MAVLVAYRARLKRTLNDKERICGKNRIVTSDKLRGDQVTILEVGRHVDQTLIGLLFSLNTFAGLNDIAILLPHNLVRRNRERSPDSQDRLFDLHTWCNIRRIAGHVIVGDIQRDIVRRHDGEVDVVPHRICNGVLRCNRIRVQGAINCWALEQRQAPRIVTSGRHTVSSLHMTEQVLLGLVSQSSIGELHRVVAVLIDLRFHCRGNVLRVFFQQFLSCRLLLSYWKRFNLCGVFPHTSWGQNTHDNEVASSRNVTASHIRPINTNIASFKPYTPTNVILHSRIHWLGIQCRFFIKNPL